MPVIAQRLAAMGLTLPAAWTPPGGGPLPYEPCVIWRGQALLAGHAPADGSRVLAKGTVGEELSVGEAAVAARQAGLSMLTTLQLVLGDLDRVTRWLKIRMNVQAIMGFTELAAVANGFTELIHELWGPAGRHARVVAGVNALPFDVPVIIDAVVAVD